MVMQMEVRLAKVSSKGQLVIPQDIRELVGLAPGDALVVYGEKDTIMLKKLKKPNLKKEFLELFEKVNKKILALGITEEDIIKASEEVRHAPKSRA
ncbi:MAG: AbrB/MazE/SpoVT family DNA-binding domain-containing protein [Methanobacteriota archaeon]